MLAVQAYELVGTELEGLHRCTGPWELEDYLDSSLAEDVDLACSELGASCTDRKERLYWVVCECRDLRIDSITSQVIDREEV